jgi:tetratricopeptide (TPR) repeat protein
MAALLAPDASAIQSLIFYYARKNLPHHVFSAASQGLTKRANDAQLLFWKAFAALREERIADAIRELEAVRGKQGVQLPVLICLKLAHESVKHVDREELQRISQDIFAEEKANRDGSLFLAAATCLFLKDNKKAREYIGKVIEINPNYPQANSLCGWIDLLSGSETKARKAQKMFDDARSANANDVDAALGIAAYYEQYQSSDRSSSIEKAVEELNKCVVKFSWFTPALSEKARLLLGVRDWEQAMEAATRSLMLNPNNIEALVITILFHLAKECKFNTAATKLAELVELFSEEEPRNAPLYLETAALISRFCNRNPAILNQCLQLVNKAIQLNPLNPDALTEQAYQLVLQGQFGKAQESYQEAAKLDEANMTALYGAILCQIHQGQLEDAAQQFEFLSEIHADASASADLAYIGALIASRKDKDAERTLAKLEEAARLHLQAFPDALAGPAAAPASGQAGVAGGGSGAVRRGTTLGELAALNPDFLLQIARDMTYLLGPEPIPQGEPPSPHFAACRRILDAVARAAPGSAEAAVLGAGLRYLRRDFEGAQVRSDSGATLEYIFILYCI